MRKAFCSLLLLSCTGACFAQTPYIIAGKHVHYYNDLPDTVMSISKGSTTYPLDINGDNIIDYSLFVTAPGGLGAHFHYVEIQTLNGNQVAYSNTDSCFDVNNQLANTHRMAKPFFKNDTIDASETWSNTLYLSYDVFVLQTYSCANNPFNPTTLDTLFIGLRAFIGTDTIYGWVRVRKIFSDISGSTCTVFDLASTYVKTGYNEQFTLRPQVEVFPNPSAGIFTISTPFQETTLSVRNLLGEIIYTEPILSNTNHIDLSAYADGVYIVSLTTTGGTQHQKIVLRRD